MSFAERRAAALQALEKSGLCRMPGSVPYLQPYEVDFVVSTIIFAQ